MAKKGGLGKGLEALFDDNSNATLGAQTMRLSQLEPNKNQPRQDFDEEAICSLADSIRQHGVLQPLLVRPLENGHYQIVAGERRWRACRMLGLDEVPVLVRELSNAETMQLALIENLQRENLNPVEEAAGYRELMDTYSMTQDAVSKIVGRSRSAVANALRLLSLPPKVLQLLRQGSISVGHAKALLSVSDAAELELLADRAAKGELTVRNVERLATQGSKSAAKTEHERSPDGGTSTRELDGRDSFFTEMALALSEELGRKVRVSCSKGGEKGTIELDFYSRDELRDFAARLTKG